MTSIRAARLADAEAMARIYNEGVEERHATRQESKEPGPSRDIAGKSQPAVVLRAS